jgi:Fe2+ or Zn2+ uptake regulation protein
MSETLAAADQLLADVLRKRGQRVTTQRVLLHRALREFDHHLSAEHLLAAVADRAPGLSLPTVYATLELFEDLGLVRRVPVPGGPTLYDPRPDAHHHVACRRCGTVEDIDTELDIEKALRDARRRGWLSVDATVVVSGLCAACARADG